MLDSVLTRLKTFSASRDAAASLPEQQQQEEREDFHLLMQCLGLLIHENHQNCDVLRSSGSVDVLIDIAMLPQEGKSALHVIQQLILEETKSGTEDLGLLLQRFQSVKLDQVEVKLNILKTIIKLFSVGPQTKKAFLEVQVCDICVSACVVDLPPSCCLLVSGSHTSRLNTHPHPIFISQGYLCVSSTFLAFPVEGVSPSEDLLAVLRLTFNVLSLVVRDSLENQDLVLREDN